MRPYQCGSSVCGLACVLVFSSVTLAAEAIPVGIAKMDITPEHPAFLAGYGGRQGEHEGVDTRLWARALAIGGEKPLLVIAVDNCGVPDPVVRKVGELLAKQVGIEPEQLVVCSTHTHSAPTLTDYAPVVWGGRWTDAERARVDRYTQWLTGRLADVGRQALAAREPAHLFWHQGRVGFGGNRRVIDERGWAGFGHQHDAPVDHSLPMLVARNLAGDPLAIWVNYACHCTTLGGRNRISGDWAGFASQFIEEQTGATLALTTIGCGADIGPQPSGSIAHAKQHGRAIATEVTRLLDEPGQQLSIAPTAEMRRIDLPLAELPAPEHWQREVKKGGFHGYHAQQMLDILQRDGELPTTVDYSLTTWTFGDDLAIVFMAGEVVVDYAVRLKTELDWRRVWINGWSNDVPCYIPSERVLREGGYEADFSQIYYQHPTRFDPAIEDLIVGTVQEMLGPAFAGDPAAGRPSFLEPSSPRELFRDRVEGWRQALSGEELEVMRSLGELAASAQEGFARLVSNDGEATSWFNYSGLKSRRDFIRQATEGTTITWETAEVSIPDDSTRQVFIFLGGMGYVSEPETDGFALLIGDEELIRFDVTRATTEWHSDDGSVHLHYAPTWTSSEDSGGFFLLEVDNARLTENSACRVAVRSRGADSQRWFAVDPIPDVTEVAEIWVRALARGESEAR